ncbi:MAG: TIGR02757 family protein [Balneola sp.]
MPRPLSKKKLLELKPELDAFVERIEQPGFIDNDPIQFMYAFEDKTDREIAGFFAAIMAWGRRDIVINKVDDLLKRMDYKPTEFVLNFSESDTPKLDGFKHRTFKPIDIYWLIKTLQSIVKEYKDFEGFWEMCYQKSKNQDRELIAVFNEEFFAIHPEIPARTRKHISNSEKNSTCKRLYMYLRWCLRDGPVDTGIMNFMPTSELKIPFDVHVARQARKLNIITYNQNNWKCVLLLNKQLTILDSNDPAKYDFALFGMGIESRNTK